MQLGMGSQLGKMAFSSFEGDKTISSDTKRLIDEETRGILEVKLSLF